MFYSEPQSEQVRTALTNRHLTPRELRAVTPAGRMARIKSRAFITFVEAMRENANATMAPL
jgi:hypothetical protein